MFSKHIDDKKKVNKPKVKPKPVTSERPAGPITTTSPRGPVNPGAVLGLQRVVGNAAVQRLLIQRAGLFSVQRDTSEEVEEDAA